MPALPDVGFDRKNYTATLPSFGLADNVGPEHAPTLNRYMQTLIVFRALPLQGRQAWVNDVSSGAVANGIYSRRRRSFSDLMGMPNKSEAHTDNFIRALSQLNMAKQGPFDFAVDEAGVNKSVYLSHWPWCLTDGEFKACKAQVDQNNLPTLNTGEPRDWLNYTETGGGLFFAAGTLAAGLSAGVLIGSGVIVGAGIFSGTDGMMVDILKARYALDEQRRRKIAGS